MTSFETDARADVVVVGGGIAGLVVAHAVARAGRAVIVCEASDRVGGLLRRGTVAGIDIDLGAESFATRTDAVAALIADADLDLDLVAPRAGGAHLAVATPGGAVRAPLPRRTILGIPADPLAPDVVRIIGSAAAARAAQERDLPLEATAVSGAEPSLFDLVAVRCGVVVAERLVDPLCRSVYSRPAASARLSELNPALWRAYLEHGSLTAAAEALASASRAGAAVGGISGGMWRLPAALAAAAQRHGAQVHTDTPVERVTGDATSGFFVHTAKGMLRADRVVVAVGPAAAAALLGISSARHDGAAARVAPGRVRVVAAAIDHSALDDFPVGSGVIVDPALPTAAKALTHATAKWPWLQAAAPTLHVVRLSARDAEAGTLVTAADVAREVTLLTGAPIQASDVRGVVAQEWPDAVALDIADVRALGAAAAARGIDLAGAAVAGTGLAGVIPHARTLAASLSTHPTRSIA